MNKYSNYCIFIFLISILTNSCNYKAGNRQPDLNFSIPISINSYYVDSYLRETHMKSHYDSPLNSELVNYPNDFIPLTDSLNKLKYVIELRVSADSARNDGGGIILSSIYSFEKRAWITDRDSLQNDILNKFKTFFTDSILLKTVIHYKKIPYSLLFIDNSPEVRIKGFE